MGRAADMVPFAVSADSVPPTIRPFRSVRWRSWCWKADPIARNHDEYRWRVNLRIPAQQFHAGWTVEPMGGHT